MNRERLIVLVEIALTVALAAVLGVISVRLPWNIAGGKVSLEMLPIMVLALRRGVWPGVIAGALFGCVDLMIEPFVVHPVQFVLDYPLAFALVGLAGVGRKPWLAARAKGEWTKAAAILVGSCALGSFARFCSHFVSGVIFFASDAPKGQPVALYSLLYNASYLLPSAILCIVAAAVLVPVLERVQPTITPTPVSA